MRRRHLLGLIGGVAALQPCIAWGQDTGPTYRLAFLVRRERTGYAVLLDELARLGFVEGRNLSVDVHGFSVAAEQLESVAAKLVKAQPHAIFAGGDAAARAAQRATTTVPIVVVADDVVDSRLVPALARPGGNLTGISILAGELNGKRLELLTEMLPGVRRIAALVDPGTASTEQLQALTNAARWRGVELSLHRAETRQEIIPAIEAARTNGAQALNVLASAFFYANRPLIIEYAAVARLSAIYQFPELCAEGALLGYGSRLSSVLIQAARMLGKVMTRTKPADVPVEQPTKFEFCVNIKAAKALGLTVPPALLARADEIIE